jgi:AraC-like DNA-binding protein
MKKSTVRIAEDSLLAYFLIRLGKLFRINCNTTRGFEEKKRVNCNIIDKSDNALINEKMFLDNNLQIDKLAREVGTNRTYLSRAIHLQKGVSYSDYVNSRRICYAKEYIQNYMSSAFNGRGGPDLTTEDLALICGFGSKRNFIRYFKRIEGVTPGQYMKGLMVRQKL